MLGRVYHGAMRRKYFRAGIIIVLAWLLCGITAFFLDPMVDGGAGFGPVRRSYASAIASRVQCFNCSVPSKSQVVRANMRLVLRGPLSF